MNANIATVDELLDYWPGNIPFKGSLVSDDGSCMCAQGQALHLLGGMSVADLRKINQAEADKRVAKLMGISRAHAVLLRNVNDGRPGAPSVVIRDPAAVLGDQAHIVLAFWRHRPSFKRFSLAANLGLIYAGVYLLFVQLHGYQHDAHPDSFRFPVLEHKHIHEDMDIDKTVDPSRNTL